MTKVHHDGRRVSEVRALRAWVPKRKSLSRQWIVRGNSRAVVALVATQACKRDEDFSGVGDNAIPVYCISRVVRQ